MPATNPTFYRSPGAAVAAAPEQLAYVAAFDPAGQAKDAIAVVDCDPNSSTYGGVVGWAELPTAGNELHHFGWNACSSALCHDGHGGHHAGHHGQPLERRYLVVPGIRSSTTYVLDTKPDPRQPVVTHTIDATELATKAGYSRPHTVHCGPGGIFMSALGGANGDEGPGGVALIDHDTFEVIGPWELDRGAQFFAYDVWWHLKYDTVLTSEWGPISMIEKGLNPEDLLGRKFGHHVNFWSMSERKLTQRVDLGDQHQMVLELRPAHDPSKAFGFVGVVISAEDLSASVWLWHQNGDRWSVDKVITIPAEPADADDLPPALKPFGAAPPLVTDIDLSVDDRWLYVSCFGTGELKRTTSATPPTRARRHRYASAGSSGASRTRRLRTYRSAVGRRWWRSAVTADGSMSPTRCTRPGMRSSIPTESAHGWPARRRHHLGRLDLDVRFFPHDDDFRGLRRPPDPARGW